MTEATPRTDLLGLEPDALQQGLARWFEARGDKPFRARQVARWVFSGEATSIQEMTDLSLATREAMAEEFDLREPQPDTISRSSDGTAKHLWAMADGELVESVLIPTPDRLTLCISSQAGCAMGCTFCATGWGGFRRHLTPGEIVGQYRASRRWAEENGYGPITNIVYMGMGEPLANLDAVMDSLTILNRGYEVGARRITVSTVGVVPGIEALARRPEQFRLALSLHSPDAELRKEIIPLEKRWGLPELMEALRAFDAAGGKRITFEYTMIHQVNDDVELAPRLAAMAKEFSAFVNLIPFNPIPWQPDWGPSSKKRIDRFRKVLTAAGVDAAVREPRGRDIDAACGQLRANALVQLDEERKPIRNRPRARAQAE